MRQTKVAAMLAVGGVRKIDLPAWPLPVTVAASPMPVAPAVAPSATVPAPAAALANQLD
jgi:hypothetical protein